MRRSAVQDLGRLSVDQQEGTSGGAAGNSSAEQSEEPTVAMRAIRRILLEDEDAEVRAQAALTLADADDRRSLSEILIACDDAHARVRQMALLALGEVAAPGDARCHEVVWRALEADAPALRFQALITASRVELPDFERRLAGALDDADPKLRYLALRLTEERYVAADDPGGSSAGERTAGDHPAGRSEVTVRPTPDPAVAASAAQSLSSAARSLSSAAESLSSAVRCLPLPTALRLAVHRALGDSDPLVAVAAAFIIAPSEQVPGPAGQILAEAINDRVVLPAPEDEQHLIELAGELGLGDAVFGLKRHAWGVFGLVPGRFAWQAKVALARLGDGRAQRDILKGLRAWNRDARTLAVVAAGRARLIGARQQLMKMRERGDAEPDALAEALRLLEP